MVTMVRKYLQRRRTPRGTAKTSGTAKITPERKEFTEPKPSLPTAAAMVLEARHPIRKKVVNIKIGLYFATIFNFLSREALDILSSFPKVRRFSVPAFPIVKKEVARELYPLQSSSLSRIQNRLKKTIAI